MYVQFSDATETVIISVFGSPQDPAFYPYQGQVEEDDPRYITFLNPGSTVEAMSAAARLQRDTILQTVYDRGINMALRAIRMATTPEETAYAESKVVELDNFAEALLGVPEQPGFPQTISWPVAPTP